MRRIESRLHNIKNNPPNAIPAILSFGWISHCEKSKIDQALLRLELQCIVGLPLFRAAALLSDQTLKSLCSELQKQTLIWQKQGFVHGDLSPRNVLVATPRSSKIPRLWFVDWVLDLKSYEATPAYASRDVYQRNRSWRSDEYALDRMIRQLRRKF